MSYRTPLEKKPFEARKRSRNPSRHHWRCLVRRVAKLKGSSSTLARGFAVGIFAGLLPLFGFQVFIAVALALLVRGNKILAATSTWVSNPLTYVPIYIFNFQVGRWLLGEYSPLDLDISVQLKSSQDIMALGSNLIKTLLIGSFTVSAVGSICSYFLFLWFIKGIRAWYYKH